MYNMHLGRQTCRYPVIRNNYGVGFRGDLLPLECIVGARIDDAGELGRVATRGLFDSRASTLSALFLADLFPPMSSNGCLKYY